jgi:hypothetical protein
MAEKEIFCSLIGPKGLDRFKFYENLIGRRAILRTEKRWSVSSFSSAGLLEKARQRRKMPGDDGSFTLMRAPR